MAKKKSESVVVVDETDKLVSDVRTAYSNFRSSWFEFAGLITRVHDDEVWSKLGHGSFKEYCLVEFNDMSYSTIVKFINVMHSHIGKLLGTKVTKNPKAALPAWETCYQLKIAEARLPKEELPVLYKDVLDGNASLNKIKQKIKEISYGREVMADEDPILEADFVEEESSKGSDVEVEDYEDDGELTATDQCALVCVRYAQKLRKGLIHLNGSVREGSRSTVDLAEVLYDDLIPVLNEYVDKLEELTNDDEED